MITRYAGMLALLLVATSALSAQDSVRWRWSVAGGITANRGHSTLFQPGSSHFRISLDRPLITGATRSVGHASVGVSRRLAGTALTPRIDLLYNRGVSAPRNASYYPPSPWLGPYFHARPALLDELVVGTVGLQWDAMPRNRFSPYVLTSAGWMYSRLHWSEDPYSEKADHVAPSHAPVYDFGVGMRYQVGRRELFLEVRRPRTNSYVYSSSILPLSFGWRF